MRSHRTLVRCIPTCISNCAVYVSPTEGDTSWPLSSHRPVYGLPTNQRFFPENLQLLSPRRRTATASMPTRPNPQAEAPPTRQMPSRRSETRTLQVPSSAKRSYDGESCRSTAAGGGCREERESLRRSRFRRRRSAHGERRRSRAGACRSAATTHVANPYADVPLRAWPRSLRARSIAKRCAPRRGPSCVRQPTSTTSFN